MLDALYKLKVPLEVGKLKEDIGLEDLSKYLRAYRMYVARFGYNTDSEDLTKRIGYLTFFTGECGLYFDKVRKQVVALEITRKVRDPNGNTIRIDGKGVTNYHKKDLQVGKEVVLLNADSTDIPPFIYIMNLVRKINIKEDIIDQQDNMLRKPILISGQGEDFDNMANTLRNILSGVEFINTKSKKNKTIMENLGCEVLNLQLNNAYKGKELWETRDKYESLLRDYLGYPTVNGDKKERMIDREVSTSSAFARTCYNEALACREKAIKDFNKISEVKLKLVKNLKWDDEEPEKEKEDKEEKPND